MEKNLDPESKDFITIAKYIMTSEEHKTFSSLPPGEREAFIEEFWKKRDPDPETERNEFKEAYLERIDYAINNFERAPADSLRDRGLIYVVFGPPDYIQQYEKFTTQARYDREVWSYRFLFDKYRDIRVYFVDRFGGGRFELARIGPIFSLIQEAKYYYLKQRPKKIFLQYDIDLKKIEKKENKVELLIRITVPYKNIWFSEVKGKMETTLSLNLKILDASGNNVWEHKQDYLLSFFEKDVEELFNSKHLMEITTTLSKGKYSLHVGLTNTAGGEEEKKVKPLKI
jgi:GWxTD domain-containing protein